MSTSTFDFDTIPAKIITMDENEYIAAQKRLAGGGLKNPISRFAAIVGKDKRETLLRDRSSLSLRALYEIEYAQSRESHSSMPSWGAVGCALSHEALWKEASKTSTGMLIFEGDVAPLPGSETAKESFKELHTFLQGKLPDLYFLGYVLCVKKKEIGLKLSEQSLGRVYGTQAYYVSPKGAEKLLKMFRPMEVQVDSYMGYITGMKEIETFFSKQNLFTQNNVQTLIQTKPVEHDSAFTVQNNTSVMSFDKILLVILCILGILGVLIWFFASLRKKRIVFAPTS